MMTYVCVPEVFAGISPGMTLLPLIYKSVANLAVVTSCNLGNSFIVVVATQMYLIYTTLLSM